VPTTFSRQPRRPGSRAVHAISVADSGVGSQLLLRALAGAKQQLLVHRIRRARCLPRSTEMVPERLQHSYPGPAGECEHGKSEALPVERLQWLVQAERRDLVRRGERELVPGYGALPLFD
jgi:hypothetical protein